MKKFEKNPLITVIISTYNRRNLLEKAILSVVNQTYKNLEIIIADNHSEDNTEEFCRGWVEKDPRIRYFRHPKNIGMTDNMNFFCTKISGEYMTILCDDDWFDLDYVEKSFEIFSKNPDCVLVSPTTYLYDENYKLIKKCVKTKLDSNNVLTRFKNYIIGNRLERFIITGLYKNEIVQNLYKIDGAYIFKRYAEDWTFIVKVLAAGKCIMIDKTHLNKVHNGCTSKLETMQEFWDMTGITHENVFGKVAENIASAILNDGLFKKYLTQTQMEKGAKCVIDTMEKFKPKKYKPSVRKLKLTKNLISWF